MHVARTVAHELGHGVFNLRHTFSEKNFVILPKGATGNLMDYPTTPALADRYTALIKTQWDLIHNPQSIIGLFDGMEEGAGLVMDGNPILRGFLASIRKNFASKSPYFSRVFEYVKTTKDFYIALLPKKNAAWYCYFSPRTGTKSDPHLIVFNQEDFYQSRIKAREVSEEFFHAAQHFHNPNQPALNKEVEVRIARAYIYFEILKLYPYSEQLNIVEDYIKDFISIPVVIKFFETQFFKKNIPVDL